MRDDAIGRMVEGWRTARPDLDPTAMAVVAWLLRAARRTDRAVEEGLAAHGLQPGWFDVLSVLRRAGAPYQVTPGKLAASVMLSTGGMTKRLDRMESAGLLERRPDPGDRRGLLITLTAKGRRVVDSAVEAHIRNEERLLRGLTAGERARLERLLRKLDTSIEASRHDQG